ncbi:MAG: cation transporter [Candidatus Geothermincolia bacterium]
MSKCNAGGGCCSPAPVAQKGFSPVTPGGVQYRIDNMDCPTEEALIRSTLEHLDGVTGLEFNLLQRTLTVSHRLDSLMPVRGLRFRRSGVSSPSCAGFAG